MNPIRLAACSLAAAFAAAAPARGALAELNVATGIMETADGSFRATDMTIARDFKLELLYNVPTATQGQWVPMAWDARNRLIVASYNSEFLGRLTIPRVGEPGSVLVERIMDNVGGAEGLLVAFNSLYVTFNRSGLRTGGVYRLTDANNDDRYDTMVPLRTFVGGGDHGKHNLRLDPGGQRIHFIGGNDMAPTVLDSSRVPLVWNEDQLLPRMDASGLGGHAAGRFAPGGYTLSFRRDGSDLRLETMGYRNAVDFEFNKDGELFVYDSDLEFDKGLPWYRPTRVTHAISGSDAGWRHGTGKMPRWYIDTWGQVAGIGSGSPTGVTVGTNARFPARYQDALYLCDWSYGNFYALPLVPAGSTYTGKAELFASGQPFAVSGTIVNPADGSLLVQTTNSQLYRITYIGSESTQKTAPDTTMASLRAQRKRLEEFHGRGDAPLDTLWPELRNPDRGIRHAARIALEWQDPAQWRERALAETDGRTAIAALVALARVSGTDVEHRGIALNHRGAPDKALQARILASLDRIAYAPLAVEDKIDFMRAYQLAFTRFGELDETTAPFHAARAQIRRPDEATRQRIIAKFEPSFPTQYRELNWEMGELLAFLEAPSMPRKMIALIQNAPTPQFHPIEEWVNPQQRQRGTPGTLGGRSNASLARQEDQIKYIELLRAMDSGWTPELKAQYLAYFRNLDEVMTPDTRYEGGSSFRSVQAFMKDRFLLKMTDAEKAAIADKSLLEPVPPGAARGGRGAAAPTAAPGGGRAGP